MRKKFASRVRCACRWIVAAGGRGFVWSVLLTASVALAQLTTGTISGTVSDPSGAAVPGATVTLKNVDTGISRTTTSGPAGRYEAPNLPVGHYEVSAVASGFRTSVRSGIELTVGRNAVVDHSLQVGEVTQAVTVTGEATFVETTTSTVSQLVDEKKVEDLPLSGRDLTQLTYLQAGVLRVPQRVSDSDPLGGAGNKLSVSGARSTQNLYLLDGVPNGDLSGNPQGVSGNYIGAETVKEFQIISNNYSAEYKSVAGAIVSAVTKSGTNAFHGSGFWTLRNDNLDAAKWEDNAFREGIKPEFKRNQYGGSLGGPISRDRTFFFGSFEGLRERRSSTDSTTLISPRALQGLIVGSSTPVAIDPAIRPYVNLYGDLVRKLTLVQDFFIPPTQPGGNYTGTESAQYAGDLRRPVDSDFVAFKMDHRLSNSHSLTGTYNWDDSFRERRDALADVSAFTTSGIRHTISAGVTSILSPTTLNEFNFGFSHFNISHEFPAKDVPDLSALAFRNDRKYVGQIAQQWGGVTSIGFRNSGSDYIQRVSTFKDGLSLTRGNHSIRTGGEINRYTYYQSACSRGCFGIWQFQSWRQFLINDPRQLESFVPGYENPPRELRQLLVAGYFQDNWRVLPSLTLNLGLRYEFITNPQEVQDRIATMVHFMDNGPSTPLKWQQFYSRFPIPFAGTIDQLYTNPTGKSFSPRVGFAWAPGDRKLSIRAGVGIFYDFPTLFLVRQTLQEMSPFSFVAQIRPVRDVPAGSLKMSSNSIFGYADVLNAKGAPALRFMEYDQKNATMYRWSFTVQREVGSQWVLSAGYTGSRAENLTTQFSANLNRWDGWPNQPTGPKHFSPNAPRINSNFAELRVQPPSVGSSYQGLALGAQKRLSHGVQLQLSYNLSKAIDQGAGTSQNSENLPQGLRGIYYWDQHLNRGLSLQDIRNSFVANFSYDLPHTRFSGAAGQVLNGWQVNGILTFLDGHPLMIEDAGNSTQEGLMGFVDNLRPNLIPGGKNNRVLGTPSAGQEYYYDRSQFVPSYCSGSRVCRAGEPDYAPGYFGNLGANTLTSPGLATFDFSVLKDFNVTEKSRIQFRAEFFNFFNRPNFDFPATNVFNGANAAARVDPNPNAARITQTLTSAREVQIGLKFIF